jgi:hypothetical protein
MLTFADDHENLKAELATIGYDGDSNLVQAILAVHVTLSSYQLSPEQQSVALDLLSSTGREALKSMPVFDENSWQDFDYGNVKISDFVRVKKDAYDSDTGSKHNGLVGVLKFMKSGHCSVEYIGLASGNTMKHPKERLESLKRSVQ